MCVSVSFTEICFTGCWKHCVEIKSTIFHIYMPIILQNVCIFVITFSISLCIILVVSKIFRLIYLSCIMWSLSSFLSWTPTITRPRWNWRLQTKIKLFPSVHRCGCLITWGHRWPQFFVPGCTTCPSTYTQAKLCGGGWLGLAVQPAAEQWDTAQQYAN